MVFYFFKLIDCNIGYMNLFILTFIFLYQVIRNFLFLGDFASLNNLPVFVCVICKLVFVWTLFIVFFINKFSFYFLMNLLEFSFVLLIFTIMVLASFFMSLCVDQQNICQKKVYMFISLRSFVYSLLYLYILFFFFVFWEEKDELILGIHFYFFIVFFFWGVQISNMNFKGACAFQEY